MENSKYKSFYAEKRSENYAQDYTTMRAEDSSHYPALQRFIQEYSLSKSKDCLEIGSSGGFFQDMVENYHGTDIVADLAQYYHKPYKVAEGKTYPFDNASCDAIWSFAVYEHIPYLQEAMLEIKRLLKKDGIVLFAPAWQCRPWAAEGYAVRPYSDFAIKGKLIKALIPLRDNIIWRSAFVFPKRIVRHIRFLTGHKYTNIQYKKITPNYEKFWTSDADACNHIDPHDAILWFRSHGFECLSHSTEFKVFTVRTGALVFQKIAS